MHSYSYIEVFKFDKGTNLFGIKVAKIALKLVTNIYTFFCCLQLIFSTQSNDILQNIEVERVYIDIYTRILTLKRA